MNRLQNPRVLLLLLSALLAVVVLAACGSVNAQPLQQSNTPTPQATAVPEATDTPADVSAETSAAELFGIVWQWQSFMDQAEQNDITVDMPEQYDLKFSDDGTVAIKADCNVAAGNLYGRWQFAVDSNRADDDGYVPGRFALRPVHRHARQCRQLCHGWRGTRAEPQG